MSHHYQQRAPRWRRVLPALGLLALGLAACSDDATPADPDGAADLSLGAERFTAGAVYTSTNAAGGNAVLAFLRGSDGRLRPPLTFPTGGAGTGALDLGSQGAVTLSDNGRWLLVVNAGSDELSVFHVRPDGLELTDRVFTGGAMPVSVTIHHDLVYVLNAAAPSGVVGFRLTPHGRLLHLLGSARPLSAPATGPAQVEFTPGGQVLVVTEKATNLITTFSVQRSGLLGAGQPQPSNGQTPFGFAFDRQGRLVVSEAFGGAPGASAVSSYALSRAGTLTTISASVPSGEAAVCWVVITPNGRLALTTNTASGTASAYAIGNQGQLSLLHAVAANTGAGSSPLDLALSRNGRFVYILAPGNGTLRPYQVEEDGTLTGLGPVDGIPASAYGLAAR